MNRKKTDEATCSEAARVQMAVKFGSMHSARTESRRREIEGPAMDSSMLMLIRCKLKQVFYARRCQPSGSVICRFSTCVVSLESKAALCSKLILL